MANFPVPLDAGSYTITGYSGVTSYYLEPSPGSFTLNGLDATAFTGAGTLVAAATGSYTITGYSGVESFYIPPAVGSYTLSGLSASLVIPGSATSQLNRGAYTVTGLGFTLEPEIVDGTGNFTLTGLSAAVTTSGLTFGAGHYALQGHAATVLQSSLPVSLNVGAYTLTGFDVAAAPLGPENQFVGLANGAYILTGFDVVRRDAAIAGAEIVGREPVQIVEIVQPFCTRTYGVAPCTAGGGPDEKCYNTRATCQDTANFNNGSGLSLYFSRGNVADRDVPGATYVIPSLRSVSTAPTRVNLASSNPDAKGLGNRAVCSLTFQDHPHTDRVVDPYVSGRSWNPYNRASFWSKWLVRNKYRQNVQIRVYEGYSGQALSEMTKRTYFLQSVTGPDSQGRVTVQGKDILARIEERKAQAPAASPGELYADITAAATSFEVANAVEADYPASGTVRINDELMTYTSRATSTNGITLSGVARGTDGTVADEHSAEDAVQECLRYTAQRVDTILEDLLTTYGEIPGAYLDTAQWAAEVTSYLSFYLMSIVISEPTSVTDLVSQLQENALFYAWWDERDAVVRIKAIRGVDAEPPTITAEDNIIEGSFSITEKPRERVSRAWVFYNHRNYVDSLTEADSYRSQSVFADLESETDNLYGEHSIRRVYAPWIQAGALADTTASKILTRFVDTPREITLRMDAKDRGYWVGDTLKVSHHLDVDSYGERKVNTWTIISAEETMPGEVVQYTMEDTTLYGRIHYIMAGGSADYPGAAAPFKSCYIGNASGLLSDGTTSGRIN